MFVPGVHDFLVLTPVRLQRPAPAAGTTKLAKRPSQDVQPSAAEHGGFTEDVTEPFTAVGQQQRRAEASHSEGRAP